MAAPNLEAVEAFLDTGELEYTTSENESGWRITLDTWVAGKDLEDLIKLIDTQPNVMAAVSPGQGLWIQTTTYDENPPAPEDEEESSS